MPWDPPLEMSPRRRDNGEGLLGTSSPSGPGTSVGTSAGGNNRRIEQRPVLADLDKTRPAEPGEPEVPAHLHLRDIRPTCTDAGSGSRACILFAAHVPCRPVQCGHVRDICILTSNRLCCAHWSFSIVYFRCTGHPKTESGKRDAKKNKIINVLFKKPQISTHFPPYMDPIIVWCCENIIQI